MKLAGSITNQFQNFQVQNLCQLVHHVEGRGPFIVTQDGAAPEDRQMRECSFVLTRRGTWLHFYLYLALPEKVRAAFTYFETVADVLKTTDSLPANVTMEDAASLQSFLRESCFEPDVSDPTGRALLHQARQRHADGESAKP
jgi:hypothetical protein